MKEHFYLRGEGEFNRARRKAVIQEVLAKIRGYNIDLLCFEEIVSRLKLYNSVTIDRGVQDIPLDQIAGSCGRYIDFTRTFIPRRAGRSEQDRWQRVYVLAMSGQGFPPIKVFKIDQVYFVQDGNHRVSVARELNWQTIPAHVSELATVFTLKPNIQPDQILIKEECAVFLEQTRLHELRPEGDVVFTSPGGYNKLLKQIFALKLYLTQKKGEDVSMAEAVAEWYDHFYEPLICYIKQSEIMKIFPRRTADDLLVWIMARYARFSPNQPVMVPSPETAEAFVAHIDELSPLKLAKIRVEDGFKEAFGLDPVVD